MCCGSCGSICLVSCPGACPSISDTFCGGCLTGAPCVVACPGACPAIAAAYCPATSVDPGSNVDLGNLPLTAPSGDPNLDGLTPSANTTDNPAATATCPSAPRGGGSGGGSAMSAGKGSASPGAVSLGAVPHGTASAGLTSLSNALARFGTGVASLFGQAETAKTGLEQRTVNAVTTPAFLMVVLIVGVLLLLLAFGRKGE